MSADLIRELEKKIKENDGRMEVLSDEISELKNENKSYKNTLDTVKKAMKKTDGKSEKKEAGEQVLSHIGRSPEPPK